MIFDKQNRQLARSLRSLYSLWLIAKKAVLPSYTP